MNLLVCGGRDYQDSAAVSRILDPLPWQSGDVLISGGASGADMLAFLWALDHGVFFLIIPANWAAHGKRAGYVRNAQMLRDGKPDAVVAFAGGAGTSMLCNLAAKAGVPVFR